MVYRWVGGCDGSWVGGCGVVLVGGQAGLSYPRLS